VSGPQAERQVSGPQAERQVSGPQAERQVSGPQAAGLDRSQAPRRSGGHRVTSTTVGSESTAMTAGTLGQTLDRLAGQRASGHQASGHLARQWAPRHLARQWAPESPGTTVGSESIGTTAGTGHQVPRIVWLDSGHRVIRSFGSPAGTASSGKAGGSKSTGMTAALGQILDRLAGQRALGHQASGHLAQQRALRHLARQWAPSHQARQWALESIGTTAGTGSSGTGLSGSNFLAFFGFNYWSTASKRRSANEWSSWRQRRAGGWDRGGSSCYRGFFTG
ncbi:unnamed protein product, partial [Staurois parvus]